LSAYLGPSRSSATCEKGGAHSGYRHLADKDEVPGSSPGRPTPHRRRSQRCRQRAGNAYCQPGPRWAARPSRQPTHWPLPGPSTGASGSTTTTHRGHRIQPGWQPRGRCGRLALQPAPAHSGPQPRALRTPTWPGRSAVKRRRPHPIRPKSATDIRLTNRRPRQHRPRPGLPGRRRAARRRGGPPGLDPFPW
jgi:hypothetical protein